ncbi:patatin-like phospholipase family protein [Hahella ganghwensis]|uniref:patatin-like phospholipase family protein n=1 Tax=Hahella ganghwensis TaxID=286420 RepID=UPI0003712F6B|nr:patatin-like phospholipase family protein [Hahella ganghwensis]
MRISIPRRWLNIAGAILTFILVAGCASRPQYNDLYPLTVDSVQKQDVSAKNVSSADQAPVIGIAFGGGGVRGFMHLGVIKALEEAGIRAQIVTGSSAGSIAATFYASGKSYEEMASIVENVKEWDVADLRLASNGFVKGEALAEWINGHLVQEDISDFPIGLGIAVTDLTERESKLIQSGNPGKAVQISSSIPGAFIPVTVNDHVYVDGGVLTLIPVRYARAMGADFVIAVDIYCGNQKTDTDTSGRILLSTFRMQSCKLGEADLAAADIVIQPEFEPENYGSFSSKADAIEAGYQATMKQLEKIQGMKTALNQQRILSPWSLQSKEEPSA